MVTIVKVRRKLARFMRTALLLTWSLRGRGTLSLLLSKWTEQAVETSSCIWTQVFFPDLLVDGCQRKRVVLGMQVSWISQLDLQDVALSAILIGDVG